MEINALAVHQAGITLAPFSYEAGDPADEECIVRVIACGVCASDLTMMKHGWRYPMVPGHEVVGEVVAVGRKVHDKKVGDRVGIGWQSGACLTCLDCLQGNENLCDDNKALIIAAYGGFADHVKVDARFAFLLPDGVETQHAGPLMCAGVTVYAALRAAGMTSGQRIGVVGVGGLGHMAIQFASKLGNDVIAFTGSPDKAEFAAKLGAADSVIVPRGGDVPGPKRKLDALLVTSSEDLPWASYVEQLGTDGTMVLVSFPNKPLAIPALPLVMKRRRVMASLIGSRASMVEMLRIADRTGVRPIVETYPFAQAAEAVGRVVENTVRYRAVITM